MDRTANARALRRRSTDAERALWAILRGRKLEGFKFRRQVPIGRYFADFACVEARLVVELDGSQHAGRMAQDERRTAEIEPAGWRVVRFWNSAVLLEPEGVLGTLRQALALAQNRSAGW